MSQSMIVSYQHIVWSTRKRQPTICQRWEPLIIESFSQTCEGLGLELVAANGAWDHIHLLIRWNATTSFAQAVCELKSRASKLCREHAAAQPVELPSPPRWQRGYSVFSVPEGRVEAVRRYIHRQKEHHRRPGSLCAPLERLWDDAA